MHVEMDERHRIPGVNKIRPTKKIIARQKQFKTNGMLKKSTASYLLTLAGMTGERVVTRCIVIKKITRLS
jgi:hypothetical protein